MLRCTVKFQSLSACLVKADPPKRKYLSDTHKYKSMLARIIWLQKQNSKGESRYTILVSQNQKANIVNTNIQIFSKLKIFKIPQAVFYQCSQSKERCLKGPVKSGEPTNASGPVFQPGVWLHSPWDLLSETGSTESWRGPSVRRGKEHLLPQACQASEKGFKWKMPVGRELQSIPVGGWIVGE